MHELAVARSGLSLALACLAAACGGGGNGQDACAEVTCSGHGACSVEAGQASCTCDAGYVPSQDGLGCELANQTACTGETCSGHGRCRLDADEQPYCECAAGYSPAPTGLECVPDNCPGDCGAYGCCGDACCQLVPTNAAVLGGFQATGLTRSASGEFDTGTQCSAGSSLGDCQVVVQAGGPGVCVCRLDELTVPASLRVTGPNALAV
ncbi:MAG TPA: hypothetical protein P5076_22950, partial [Myxococcota bacterium]|nr:hypothetical protein [Myxococcota bacterium]